MHNKLLENDIPDEVMEILGELNAEQDYRKNEAAKPQLNSLGYDIDWDLSGEITELTKLN